MALRMRIVTAILTAAIAIPAGSAAFAGGEVNLYSSRHYDTDERLYSDFEKETGIKINRIEGNADELIERLKAEGANSPADVLITVDAGRIWRAADAGLFSPVDSPVLEERIPEALQHPDNLWFGFSTRARIIFYAKDRVTEPPQTYAELADPKYKGKICTRSGSNIYMLSLLASRIAEDGADAAKAWAQGAEGQSRSPPAGRRHRPADGRSSPANAILHLPTPTISRARCARKWTVSPASTDQIGWVFPDQQGRGAHINISAAGVLANAPNRDNAIRFLEYLSSDTAQEYFATGNDEYPVVEGVGLSASVNQLGTFKADDLNLSALGENQAAAQDIYNAVGYK